MSNLDPRQPEGVVATLLFLVFAIVFAAATSALLSACWVGVGYTEPTAPIAPAPIAPTSCAVLEILPKAPEVWSCFGKPYDELDECRYELFRAYAAELEQWAFRVGWACPPA